MQMFNEIEELKQAHDQGFLTDDDFVSRMSLLSPPENSLTGDSTLTDEVEDLAKRVLKSDMATDMASGAVAGAVIASVVPLVGTGLGAVLGASFGAYKNFTKKE